MKWKGREGGGGNLKYNYAVRNYETTKKGSIITINLMNAKWNDAVLLDLCYRPKHCL